MDVERNGSSPEKGRDAKNLGDDRCEVARPVGAALAAALDVSAGLAVALLGEGAQQVGESGARDLVRLGAQQLPEGFRLYFQKV